MADVAQPQGLRNLHQAAPDHRWLRPFLRRTAGNDFVPVIDGLRFYAIAAVLAYHIVYNLRGAGQLHVTQPWLWAAVQVAGGGFIGVNLFFAISGFILAVPFAGTHLNGRAPVRLSRYYLRRLTRLEPPYLLSLAVLFAVRTWVMGVDGLTPHLLASSVYLHNALYGYASTVSTVTWSLEVEVQFYLVAPLLGQLFRVRPTWLRRLCLVALGLAVAYANARIGRPAFAWLLPNLNYFLVGFLLADVHALEWKAGREVPNSALWDGVATLGWALIGWSSCRAPELFPLLPVFVLATYYAILRSRLWYWLTSRPLLYVFGGMCYTIYLYHNALIRAVIERTPWVKTWNVALGGDAAWMLVVPLCLGAVLLVCVPLFVVVERPCMEPDWHRRAWRWVTRRVGAT